MTNTATYCDGLSREFTVRFTALVTGSVFFAAIAGTTCTDPLDCLAMTAAEAAALATGSTAYYAGATAEVIALPDGWSND